MLAISTVIGILMIAAAVIVFVKLAKGTIVTIIAVAGLIIGIFLVFGPASIPNLEGYVDKANIEQLQDMIPTGGATYAPYDIKIESVHNDSGLLVLEVKNMGDFPLEKFEIIANGQIPVRIIDPPNSLPPEASENITAQYNIKEGDIITVISHGASDSVVFNP